MYVLFPQIAGCRPYHENNNRWRRHPPESTTADDDEPECRETVAIPLSSLPTYEAVAQFYSYLAYPDPEEATQRKNYSIAFRAGPLLSEVNWKRHGRKESRTSDPSFFRRPRSFF
jgi:hypothetical protein